MCGGTNGVSSIGALCLNSEDVSTVVALSPNVASRAGEGVLDGVGDASDTGSLGADDAACGTVVGGIECSDECRVAVVRGHDCVVQ